MYLGAKSTLKLGLETLYHYNPDDVICARSLLLFFLSRSFGVLEAERCFIVPPASLDSLQDLNSGPLGFRVGV